MNSFLNSPINENIANSTNNNNNDDIENKGL